MCTYPGNGYKRRSEQQQQGRKNKDTHNIYIIRIRTMYSILYKTFSLVVFSPKRDDMARTPFTI